MSTTTQEPDFAGIAKRLSEREYPAPPYEPMPEGLGEVFAPDVRYTKQFTYASCMEAKLRSDWETIRLLRESKAIHLRDHADEENDPSEYFADLSAHLSTLEAQFQ
jgi:hypothetical protein